MYEQVEKSKENKSRSVANAVAQKKGNVKLGFGFVDNRVFQRNSINNSVIQLASVGLVSGNVSQDILDEVQRIVQAAENAGGTRSNDHTLLDKIEEKKSSVSKNFQVGSQSTWGVAAIQLENSAPYLVTVGQANWANAMGSNDHLKGRPSTLHAEMALVAERPGVVAISATQDCCLFCYGYLASRSYEHPALRSNVWPNTGWTHPQDGFKLLTGGSAVGNVISVNYKGTTRQFQVY